MIRFRHKLVLTGKLWVLSQYHLNARLIAPEELDAHILALTNAFLRLRKKNVCFYLALRFGATSLLPGILAYRAALLSSPDG